VDRDSIVTGPAKRCQRRKRRAATWSIGLVTLAGIVACAAPSNAPAPAPTPSPAAAKPQVVLADVAAAIRDVVSSGRTPMPTPLTPVERQQLATFYAGVNAAPQWIDVSGRPNEDARAAMTVLAGAAADALDPADYAANALAGRAAALDATTPTPDIAAFDVDLSASVLRYLRHLHSGRVDPRTIGFRMTTTADGPDVVAALRAALASHRITDAAAELAPPLVLYRSLRSALARYRAMAASTPDPAFAVSATIKPGDRYADAATLRRYLIALGDLPSNATTTTTDASDSYDALLVDGVKHFQMRHGLEPDGVLGRTTHAELRVPLARRVRQIELALERLRWLPRLSPDGFIGVNVPMFHLWVWDAIPPNGAPTFGMNVIVGRALNTQTPVFVEEMRYVIFRPYWNVPASIVRGEMLPAFRRDPNYFARHDLELVDGPGDDARPVAVSEASVAQLQQGRLRVRQRPGPSNSLGLVKFVFPNDDNVYLHGTPAPELFKRTRRDFSHGCVRVEDPVALAQWVLKGRPEWTRDRILAAMQAPRPQRVDLPKPLQVILFYITAVVMPEDGTVHFADDIYGHDAKLDRALTQRGR
jgi:murein L,D-transpeptidase YcbB/YkuD